MANTEKQKDYIQREKEISKRWIPWKGEKKTEKALIEKIREDNESYVTVDTDRNFSPMMVSLQFPKRGEASRKRKNS